MFLLRLPNKLTTFIKQGLSDRSKLQHCIVFYDIRITRAIGNRKQRTRAHDTPTVENLRSSFIRATTSRLPKYQALLGWGRQKGLILRLLPGSRYLRVAKLHGLLKKKNMVITPVALAKSRSIFLSVSH